MFDCWKVAPWSALEQQNRAGEKQGVETLANGCLRSECLRIGLWTPPDPWRLRINQGTPPNQKQRIWHHWSHANTQWRTWGSEWNLMVRDTCPCRFFRLMIQLTMRKPWVPKKDKTCLDMLGVFTVNVHVYRHVSKDNKHSCPELSISQSATEWSKDCVVNFVPVYHP